MSSSSAPPSVPGAVGAALTAFFRAPPLIPEDIASYLMIFKYGMPPHGGLGIGLERLTMRLLDEQNVREAALFPRDVTRLEP